MTGIIKLLFPKRSRPRPDLARVREIRARAIREVRQAKATLDDEDDWFLCIRKRSKDGEVTFASCVPKGLGE